MMHALLINNDCYSLQLPQGRHPTLFGTSLTSNPQQLQGTNAAVPDTGLWAQRQKDLAVTSRQCLAHQQRLSSLVHLPQGRHTIAVKLLLNSESTAAVTYKGKILD